MSRSISAPLSGIAPRVYEQPIKTLRPKMLMIGVRSVPLPAWWLDPARAILFIVLPIFCAAAYLNRFNYADFNASENFVTWQTFGLAMLSMALLVLGIMIGRSLQPRRDLVTIIDASRAEKVLIGIGSVTILAYVILLGALVTQLPLVLNFIRGDIDAGTELRQVLGRVPGITSFIQFGIVYLSLLTSLVVMAGYRPSTRILVITGIIIIATFLRAVLASERLAMLEAIAAIFVIPAAFRWQPSLRRGLAPLIGIVLVFAAFSAGEYFRSWQYYQSFYDSYFDFISQRFFGYFSTSINNGSGAYTLLAQYGPSPEITSAWITRFPLISNMFKPSSGLSLLDTFLATYATPEFNNPGGFYAAYLDYPFIFASIFMLLLGIVIGAIYRSFQNKTLIGLMLYPAVFLGQTDFIRLIYIADVRTLPIFLGVFVAWYALRPTQVTRNRAITAMAATKTS